MRVILASNDREAVEWLEGVLTSAGLSVVVLRDASGSDPELSSAELLIADRTAAASIGQSGPKRRLLLVPRGHAVDLSDALTGGFMNLLIVPSPEDEILTRVGSALDRFLKPVQMASGSREQIDELKGIVNRVVDAIEASGPELRRATHELTEGMLSVFLLLIDSHETTNQGAPAHSRRTGGIVRRIARRLGYGEEEVAWLELAGRLHDIGLVPLQLSLADKAHPLSLELRRGLVQHPKLGADILGPLSSWGLPVDAIRWHHERIDGSGYPDGLVDVPIEAQIVGAADVLEALTSKRPWRPAETQEAAIDFIRRSGGFSDRVLDSLIGALSDDEGRTSPLPRPPGPQDGG